MPSGPQNGVRDGKPTFQAESDRGTIGHPKIIGGMGISGHSGAQAVQRWVERAASTYVVGRESGIAVTRGGHCLRSPSPAPLGEQRRCSHRLRETFASICLVGRGRSPMSIGAFENRGLKNRESHGCAIGSLISTSRPLGDRLRQWMVPPQASMQVCTIAKPRPTPPVSRWRANSGR